MPVFKAPSSATSLATDTLADAKGDVFAATAADTIVRVAVGSDGQVLTADSASGPGVKWATPAGGSSAPLVSTGAAASTEYVFPQFVAYGSAGRSIATGFMGFTPMWLPAGTYDRIGCRINTVGSAGAVVRLGIYSADANNKPSTLVLDAGTVAGDATTGFKEITISHTQASAGLVFLAGVTQTAAVTMMTADAIGYSGLFPIPNSAGFGASGLTEWSWNVNGGVTGALPSTPTVSKNSNAQWLFAMCLRKA